jgi:hypothetical protein
MRDTHHHGYLLHAATLHLQVKLAYAAAAAAAETAWLHAVTNGAALLGTSPAPALSLHYHSAC